MIDKLQEALQDIQSTKLPQSSYSINFYPYLANDKFCKAIIILDTPENA